MITLDTITITGTFLVIIVTGWKGVWVWGSRLREQKRDYEARIQELHSAREFEINNLENRLNMLEIRMRSQEEK